MLQGGRHHPYHYGQTRPVDWLVLSSQTVVKYSAVSSMAFLVQSGGREFVLSVGLEGEAALHHWVGGLQQVPEQMPLRFSFLSNRN